MIQAEAPTPRRNIKDQEEGGRCGRGDVSRDRCRRAAGGADRVLATDGACNTARSGRRALSWESRAVLLRLSVPVSVPVSLPLTHAVFWSLFVSISSYLSNSISLFLPHPHL